MNTVSNRFDLVNAEAAPVIAVMMPDAATLALAGLYPVRQIALDALSAACRDGDGRGIVACPLIFGSADALCVIAALLAAEFTGTLVVVAPPLPDRDMVTRELSAAARDITLRLVQAE